MSWGDGKIFISGEISYVQCHFAQQEAPPWGRFPSPPPYSECRSLGEDEHVGSLFMAGIVVRRSPMRSLECSRLCGCGGEFLMQSAPRTRRGLGRSCAS